MFNILRNYRIIFKSGCTILCSHQSSNSSHLCPLFFFNILFYFILFRLRRVLVAACELLAVACMRDLTPRPGMEPRSPALGVRSLTHWTTREVPPTLDISIFLILAILTSVYYYLTVVLAYISPVINDIQHLFMCLFVTPISSC